MNGPLGGLLAVGLFLLGIGGIMNLRANLERGLATKVDEVLGPRFFRIGLGLTALALGAWIIGGLLGEPR